MSAYAQHLATLTQRLDRLLPRCGFDHLLIPAGVEKYNFLDDTHSPFKVNPHFKAWLPLTQHPHSWISYTPGSKPMLVYFQPDDYWHLPPSDPHGEWVQHFDIRVIREASEAALHLPREGRLAIIGEADAAVGHAVPNNPENLLHALHFHRAVKTPYELACMRGASLLGARGHVAAAQAFLQGASEAEIHSVYLLASDMTDRELPYANIVGLNEHAAVLHYQFQDRERPAEHRTLLVDGGADFHGYASDITRTWTTDEGDFQALIDAMDQVELALVDQVRAGTDYKHIHLDAHRRIAGVLSEHRIVNVSAEAALAEGLTHTFFPHGIGHFLGLQVHDVGALIGDEDGTRIERPDGHRYLRLTRPLEAGMVVTIEPGLYFIPSLLKKLEQSPQSAMVNWGKVQAMLPFGGIRIEDDVVCTDGAPENMTRDAFTALEP